MACKKWQASTLKILKKAWDSLPDGPHKRIRTIKGVGVQTAAALVAKMVSNDRFQSDSSLIACFGVLPGQHDSGVAPEGKPKSGSYGRMCNQGNDLVRRLLYTAAQSAAKHNPAVRALYARQMRAGKAPNAALGHCMTKLLRQVFALWTKDEDFDPEYEAKRQLEKTNPANKLSVATAARIEATS